MKLLKDKVALITGGARGIGRSICESFAENGCNVAFTYNNSKEAAEELVKELKKYDVKVKSYKSDASDHDKSVELIDNVISDFERIDVLVNNAGITKDNLLMRMSPSDFKDVVNVNLGSVFNLTKSSIRIFLKQKEGSIINISSIVGVKGNAGQSNYAASKAGIVGFSKSIALELGSDVLEKWKESIPLKRSGKPNDVGNACVFLASDLSSYITGQVLQVDGGLLT